MHGTGGDKSQLPVLPSPAWLPLVAVGGGAWAGGDTGPDSGTVTRPRHQTRHGQDTEAGHSRHLVVMGY